MGKTKISEETWQRAEILRSQGLTNKEISERLEIPFGTLSVYLTAKNKGFDSIHEYQEHLVKERGFSNRVDYMAFLKGPKNNNGRKSQKKTERRLRYEAHLAKEGKEDSPKSQKEYLAKEAGFSSIREYDAYNEERRLKKIENQLSKFIIGERLRQLGQNQAWLANQLGVTESAVSRYASGKTTPKKKLKERLITTLRLSKESLEDLVRQFRSQQVS